MALVDVTDAFDDIVEDIQVESYSAGIRVKGIWQNGIMVIDDALAVVQPATQNDITNFTTEGQTSGSYKKFYSTYNFKSTNEDAQTPSDIIIYNGDRFKVVDVADWLNMGGYKKVITQKLETE